LAPEIVKSEVLKSTYWLENEVKHTYRNISGILFTLFVEIAFFAWKEMVVLC